MTNDTTSEQTIQRVMGIFAHPDDPEFFAGATLARWAAKGTEVTIVVATSGDKGSDDPEMTSERLREIREQEERNSTAVLGAKEVIFLRYPDGELRPSLGLRRDLTRLIRMKKPDLVITSDPTVFYRDSYINHPDHRAIGVSTLEAVFPAARDRLNFVELARDEGLQPHKVRLIYIAGSLEPTLSVDVTDYLETKIDALREHKSQIKDMVGLAERLRERYRDSDSPADAPRYYERFRLITLS